MEVLVAAAPRARLDLRWLGRVSYDAALALQREAAARAAAGEGETLLLLEHEPIYTLGRNAQRGDVLWSPAQMREQGIAVRESDRGGKVTYHGPGQLVGYPVLRLAPGRRDVKRYVWDLEEVLIRTLADFGIEGARSQRPERVTSVWVGDSKIAAIGIHIARWVTTHGFALNVTDEPLARFAGIVPCGITDAGVTSIQRAHGGSAQAPSLAEVRERLVRRFEEVLEREIIGS